MRILLVTPSYFPIVGGSEVLTRILSTKLNQQDVHVDVMTFNMNKKWLVSRKTELIRDGEARIFKEGGFNPFRYVKNPLSNLLGTNIFPKLAYTKRFSEYDIIHFIGEADLSFPFYSLFVNKPKILQCVGIYKKGGIYKYYIYDRTFLGGFFRNVFPRLADKFVVSTVEERELIAEMGISLNKIIILPLGVDTEVFKPAVQKKTGRILLFVGRIDRIKGLHVLLESLQYIDQGVKVIVIGPYWDSEYVKEIEVMSNNINNAGLHSIVFLGELNSEDLVPWYQKASMLVCPYLYETHSNVVREALACGTPVVSTGSHLTTDGSDGILVTQRNPKTLGNAINKLLENSQECERLGKQGRIAIEQYFSWDFVIQELISIYKDTLSECSRY